MTIGLFIVELVCGALIGCWWMGTGWKCPSSSSGRPHPTHSHVTVGTHTHSPRGPRWTLGPCLWGTGAWSDCHPEKFACRVLTALLVLQHGVSRASTGGGCLSHLLVWHSVLDLQPSQQQGYSIESRATLGSELVPRVSFSS